MGERIIYIFWRGWQAVCYWTISVPDHPAHDTQLTRQRSESTRRHHIHLTRRGPDELRGRQYFIG
jgi:hypothetical protein